MMIEIRNVNINDSKELLKINNYYIKNTAITFETKELELNEFEERIKKISSKYPYLVLLDDGVIKGYAYSHEFYGREAYRFSNEVTIYLDKDDIKEWISNLKKMSRNSELKLNDEFNINVQATKFEEILYSILKN